MSINRYLHGMLGVVAFMAVVWGAQLSGNWTTSGKVGPSGERIEATGKNVEEIKGWMEVGDVAAAYGVRVEDLYAAFGLPPETPPTTALKDFEKVAPGFELPKLRAWLAARS